jgi:hypothetical protein
MTRLGRCPSFGCHVAVGDVAPGFHVREISGEACSPWLIVTCFRSQVLAVIRQPWWMVPVGFGWQFVFVFAASPTATWPLLLV